MRLYSTAKMAFLISTIFLVAVGAVQTKHLRSCAVGNLQPRRLHSVVLRFYYFTMPDIFVKKRSRQIEIKRQELCDKFYLELRNWYFWATEKSRNPDYSLRLIISLY
ncbi:MAG: hypothetical protein LBP59_17700 [Planctomycetaceae bacterium]|jgi:hypothetical protein|nr:hypothetical protein [Planctomycetaceae bacterium]